MKSIICDKSFDFAVQIVLLVQQLQTDKKEYILSKQILRSATSIGANTTEAQAAISKADFSAKMAIAHKKAVETSYWLTLLNKTDFITNEQYNKHYANCTDIIAILCSIVKSCRERNFNKKSVNN